MFHMQSENQNFIERIKSFYFVVLDRVRKIFKLPYSGLKAIQFFMGFLRLGDTSRKYDVTMIGSHENVHNLEFIEGRK